MDYISLVKASLISAPTLKANCFEEPSEIHKPVTSDPVDSWLSNITATTTIETED